MKQGWNFGVKTGFADRESGGRGASKQFRKEFLRRAIAGGRRKIESNLVSVERFKQKPQTLMFDTTGECPAAHDPGIHRQLAAAFSSTQDDRDLAQRAILILVRGSKEKSRGVLKKDQPIRFAESLAIEIKLVGFIDQLEGPVVARVRSQTEGDVGFGIAKEIFMAERTPLKRVSQCGRGANTA